MSVQLTFNLPESAFSALRTSPNDFLMEMRIAAAVKWYELEKISQAKAAELAGLSRAEFIDALARYHDSPFQVTERELIEEINRE